MKESIYLKTNPSIRLNTVIFIISILLILIFSVKIICQNAVIDTRTPKIEYKKKNLIINAIFKEPETKKNPIISIPNTSTTGERSS